MSSPSRGHARAVPNTDLFCLFRAFEQRVGVAGLALIILFTLCQPILAHEFKAGSIVVHHPWSRATPSGAKVAAGYATIQNAGSQPDRLIGVSGEIAARSEVHEMALDGNGVMTMRPVQGIDIPAGGQVELKPGGFHIMFLDLSRGAREGERFKGSLTFEMAGKVEVEFAVESMGGDGGGHGNHGG